MKNIIQVNTSVGYEQKPKNVKGYKLERYYCECGCKNGYWHYVRRMPKPKKLTNAVAIKLFRNFIRTHHLDRKWEEFLAANFPEKQSA